MTAPAVDLSPIGKAAMAYALRLRWSVFPLRGKVPAIQGGRGCLDASSTPEQIRQWWSAMPDANLGVATGARSGIVVIDLDGPEAEAAFSRMYGNPPTPSSITGRGRHIVFEHPGIEVRNSAGLLGPGIDVRGDGGYIVAPPSVHPDTGKPYRWESEVGLHPLTIGLAPLPQALREALSNAPRSGTALVPASDIAAMEQIPDGQRNATLTRYAGRLLAKGHSQAETLELVYAINLAKAKPPLPRAEVTALVASLSKREALKPARTTTTGQVLQVQDGGQEVAPAEMPTPHALATQQITSAIEKGRRDATDDARWAFYDLDRLTGTMSPGEFWVVGALPSNGKTALMFTQMAAFAEEGTPVLYLPLELDPDDLRRRWAAWSLGLDVELVAKNQWNSLPPGSQERHEDEMRRQVDALVQIPGDRRITVEALDKWMRWGVDSFGARIVVVDHFHRMDFGSPSANYRVQVSDAVRRMKDLAREHRLTIVATAQLNGDGDPLDRYYPPHLRRLKESSAIGEEADVVLMLSRRLATPLDRDDIALIRAGAKSERDYADPGCMLVTCRKHRLADTRAGDRSVRLLVRGGKVENMARFDGENYRSEWTA